MNALRKLSLGASGRITKILQVKMGKKLSNLNRYVSVISDIDEKWFVVFEHSINHPFYGYVRLPQLEYYFSCFAYFFLFFYFSSGAMYL